MDILDAPELGPPPGEGPKVGRPAIGAAQRALSDDRYKAMTDMMEALPPSAREFRFKVYRGSRRTSAKIGFRPLREILFSKYTELGLKDEMTLANYLLDELGAGYYIVEAYDNLNQRLEKLPPIPVKAGHEDDMDDDDEDYDDDRPRRRRRSRSGWRQRDDWDDDDDDRDARVNTADMMSTIGRQTTAQVAQVSKSSNDMLSMMMMSQNSNAEARAAEERRRDEQRMDERKREEMRAEERRHDAEKERELREEREERRRDEAKQAYEREENRRRDETIRLMDASNKKTEILLGAFTAAIPVIQKIFEPKEDKTLPLLISSLNRPPDPMMSTLLQGIVAKANDPNATSLMMNQMMEMSKISSQLNAEQVKSMMTLSNDMNGTIMKKAMEMMMASPEGKTPEGKSMIEQVMGALGSVAEIVKTLVPPSAPSAPQPRQQVRNVQHVPVQPAQLPAPAAAPQGAIVPAGPVTPGVPMTPAGVPIVLTHPDGTAKTPAEVRWETLTPEQQQAEAAQAPRGTTAVLAALRAIHTEQHGNQAEYQQLVGYLVNEMPLDLRVAVLDGNELGIAQIVMPVAKTDPELWSWLTTEAVPASAGVEAKPSTLDWIRSFVPLLPSSIEAVHGPADAQRAALASGVAPQVGTPVAPEPAVAEVVPATEATPSGTVDATPTPTGEAAPIIQGPGSVSPEASPGPVSPLAAAAVASIDPDDP